MKRNIGYWGATGLVATVALLGGFSYVTNSPEAIENFRHVGYPQQLRVLLGIAKLAGAIVLLLPWLPTLKEWAYAGLTFTWIAATVAHYLAADGLSLLPVALLGALAVSYVTRPANRRGFAKSMLAQGDGSIPLPASGPYGGFGRVSKIFVPDEQ
jgi:DoxX-like protein